MADPQFPANDDQTTGENVASKNEPAGREGGESLEEQLTEDLSVQGGE